MQFPHGERLTLRSVTTVRDALGNETTTVVESSWGPCAVSPRYDFRSIRRDVESTDPRVAPIVVGLTVYGPPVAIGSDDLIVRDGIEYQVEGRPAEWVSPFTGWAPGVELQLKRAGA